jgi:hypothetical protein
MKTNRITTAGFMSALVLVGALAAIAQQTSQRGQTTTDRNRATADTRSTAEGATQDIGQLDNKSARGTVRASQIIGQNLKNSNGDSVGEVNDLVLDSSGKVRYAAVTYGGFLGVGTKMFAVPFEAFKVRQNPNDPNDRGDYVLTLDVTKEQLDGAQGFDNDHWPDFADTKITQDLDRRYKVDRTRTGARR